MKNKNKSMKNKKNLIKMKVDNPGIEIKHASGASKKIKSGIINRLLSAACNVVFFQDILALAATRPLTGKRLQGSIEYIMILSAVTIG